MGPTFGVAPRIYNWGANLQREISKFLFEIEYAGNRGYRLNSTIDLNQVNPSYLYLGSLLQQSITSQSVVAAGFKKPYANFPDNGTLAQSLRPFPQFLNVFSRNSGRVRPGMTRPQSKSRGASATGSSPAPMSGRRLWDC
jgi:hypothetical protein